MKSNEIKIGQKVQYKLFKNCNEILIENGIIKSFSNSNDVFVVYKCNNDWDYYYNYTAAKTCIKDLKEGWK